MQDSGSRRANSIFSGCASRPPLWPVSSTLPRPGDVIRKGTGRPRQVSAPEAP